ncbi:hypothetical protein RHVP.R11 [Cricetid gammaherpesvirus 2]|uniref:Uncharacterized protein n=1 Tax=Cricetid gammaherpesvirus 2 TaxID=1605972 RepID=E9M5J1_9GAMA|nr:hypothetical protein RHVP.R11 [Cricetid gammaherpesvirus 2]ADW24349.1 hypothetical protein RHVP.R11 [Cricetid gammaherpesvirus 2]ADW24431.1 hypothetical protein RHVP-L.R11 [Cricetid gammaherpesvirus 2]
MADVINIYPDEQREDPDNPENGSTIWKISRVKGGCSNLLKHVCAGACVISILGVLGLSARMLYLSNHESSDPVSNCNLSLSVEEESATGPISSRLKDSPIKTAMEKLLKINLTKFSDFLEVLDKEELYQPVATKSPTVEEYRAERIILKTKYTREDELKYRIKTTTSPPPELPVWEDRARYTLVEWTGWYDDDGQRWVMHQGKKVLYNSLSFDLRLQHYRKPWCLYNQKEKDQLLKTIIPQLKYFYGSEIYGGHYPGRCLFGWDQCWYHILERLKNDDWFASWFMRP